MTNGSGVLPFGRGLPCVWQTTMREAQHHRGRPGEPEAFAEEDRMRYRLLRLLPLPLLVVGYPSGAHAQYYPYPGNYTPDYSQPGHYNRPAPAPYYSWPGHPPPDSKAPPLPSAANCGSSEHSNPCARQPE
jgi:hypothetical protein